MAERMISDSLVELMDGAVIDYDSSPYWERCLERTLELPRCNACQYVAFPPRSRCPRCWGTDLPFRPVGTTGRIFTYIPVPNQDFAAMALVQLDAVPEVRLPAPIVGCPTSEVGIGGPVRLVWIEVRGTPLPAFALEAEHR
jgi:hypothetical protein